MRPQLQTTAYTTIEEGLSIDINKLHTLLGHPSEETLRLTAKNYAVKVHGKFNPCFACALAKSKQKRIKKESETKSKTRGERLYIDTSSIKTISFGGAKFWLLIVDDYSDMSWSYFLRAKSEVVTVMVQFINNLIVKNVHVKYIRCDNAGENMSLQKECEKKMMGIMFEFTGPGSPQYNGRVERKFATLYGKVRTILNEAQLTSDLRRGLWAEACNFVTDLINHFLIREILCRLLILC